MGNQNLTAITEGIIQTPMKDWGVETLEWRPHASFSGVSMKHLITSEATGGHFSVHLVRVEAGCALADHAHEGRWELHQVLEGRGTARLGEKSVAYDPSVWAVIPADTVHRVDAEEPLLLLAKFVPALL